MPKIGIRLKEVKTFEEQLDILKDRNLIISDIDKALNILRNVNYYRLSGYYPFFYIKNTSDCKFNTGTTFEDIYQLYCFDKELRVILFGLTQGLEIMVRTHLAYEIAHKYGVDGWESVDLFFDYDESCNKKKINMCESYTNFRSNINKKIKRSKEIFIKHHQNNYDSKFPVWVVVETLDFGDLSKLYKNMKTIDKNHIAREYYNKNKYVYIENWLEMSVILRNICAHHGRIYGRNIFTIKKNKTMSKYNFKGLFALIIGIKEMMGESEDWNKFVEDIIYLSDKYPNIDFKKINFPESWKDILK